MSPYLRILLILGLLHIYGQAKSQFTGGIGNGFIAQNLPSPVTCAYSYGDSADGFALGTLFTNVSCFQALGDSADGSVMTWFLNPDSCEYFLGGQADGNVFAFLANPDSCGYFDGGIADGLGRAFLPNPDTCGQFEGGLADGISLGFLANPVPCSSYRSSNSDGFALGLAFCLPLEVQASPLEGIVTGGNGKLWWHTFSETNNLGFAIQKSLDQHEWKEIGFIEGQDRSDQMRRYQFYDFYMKPGLNYYRYEQIDHDGSLQYSNVVTLVKNQSQYESLLVYPNPALAGNDISVLFEAPETSPLKIQVYDIEGKILFEKAYIPQEMPFKTNLDTAQFPAGMFFLILTSEKEQLSRSFIVY